MSKTVKNEWITDKCEKGCSWLFFDFLKNTCLMPLDKNSEVLRRFF